MKQERKCEISEFRRGMVEAFALPDVTLRRFVLVTPTFRSNLFHFQEPSSQRRIRTELDL
jgi:hypothetical protein